MKSFHPDRNQENVPFLQSAIGKRFLAQFPLKPYLTNTSLAELKLGFVPPTPYTGTGKRNAYLYDSNKAYLSYQHIKSYVSSLSNSSLTDFLLVTITPYRKDLDLQEAEVIIGQTEDNQEVDMEVQECSTQLSLDRKRAKTR